MLTQLHGKPFTITLDGKARTIGTISAAFVDRGRTHLGVTVELTDEEVAGILGAAQDKAEAAASPIGLSEAELDAAIADAREDLGADPGPFVGTRSGRIVCGGFPNLVGPLPNDFESGAR